MSRIGVALPLAALLATALTGLSPTTARADFFAAVNVAPPAGRTDFDVAIVNASTGARVPLPAGVNTAANETHPDITPDGKRLTFERIDTAAGTTRIILVDLSTGQSADLFTGFEAASSPPADPSITPDGQTVATGGPFKDRGGGPRAEVTLTDVRGFPSGPFPHTPLSPPETFPQYGNVSNPEAGEGNVFVFSQGRGRPGDSRKVTLAQPSGFSSTVGGSFVRGALAANNAELALLEHRIIGGAPATIRFLPATAQAFPTPGVTTLLPPIVNSQQADESQPALSSDGRYVAFVRHGADARDRLFLWDSQTQTLLNTNGVSLGSVVTRDVGNVGLSHTQVFKFGSVQLSGLVSGALAVSSGVGILVQRIKGRSKTRIFGRRTHRLRTVGRVPLGRFRKGRFQRRWNLKVAGKRLRAGRYLVTLRAVSSRKSKIVRELGKPRVIRVKKRKRGG